MRTIIKSLLFIIFLISQLLLFSQENNYNLDAFKMEMEKLLSPTQPGMAIMITRNDKIIFEEYFGYANLEKNERLSRDHTMGIASMSKQFEGMAALILVEQGKINLDEDIKTYFPDLPIGEREISVRQLLSHTSGLPEITRNDEFMNHIDQKRTPKEIIEIALRGDYTGEPGLEWKYCNTGYTMVVELIEQLSGKSYAEFLKENILKPLEMNQTYSCDYNHDATNTAIRYVADSLAYEAAEYMHFSNLIGGGGMISTALDISKWNRALLCGKNLPENYREIWKSNTLNNGEETGYGLGMGNNEYKGISYYYHPGMGHGMNSVNFIIPKDNVAITVIRNMSKPELNSIKIATMAMDYLLGLN